jgi:hypothetical protein
MGADVSVEKAEGGAQGGLVVVVVPGAGVRPENRYVTLKLPEPVVALSAEITAARAARCAAVVRPWWLLEPG